MRNSVHILSVITLLTCSWRYAFALIDGLYPGSGIEQIQLLYSDADIIVLNKPPNMNTAPGVVETTSLAGFVADMYSIPRVDRMIVHRLDYATSGVVVLARNLDALTALHRQFRIKQQVFKAYTAVVHGHPLSSEGEVDLPIGRDSLRGSPFQCVSPEEGKASLTHWTLLRVTGHRSLLLLRPITGRTHQLRVHLASIGLPIVGDKFYCSDKTRCGDETKGIQRLFLHAEMLGIVHPRTNVPLRFTARRPFEFY